MKRILLIIFTVAGFSLSAVSQQWGVSGGAALSNKQTIRINEFDVTSNMNTGIEIGLFYEYVINDNWSLQPELQVIQKGISSEIDLIFQGIERVHKIDNSTQLLFMELPVNVYYNLPLNRDSYLKFGAGGYAAYALSGTTDIKLYDDYEISRNFLPLKDGNVDFNNEFKRFDAGVQLGAAYRYSRYQISLTQKLGMLNYFRKGEIKSRITCISFSYYINYIN